MSRPSGPSAPSRRPRPARTTKPATVQTGRPRRSGASAKPRTTRGFRRPLLLLLVVAGAGGLALAAYDPIKRSGPEFSRLVANTAEDVQEALEGDKGANPQGASQKELTQRASPATGARGDLEATGASETTSPQSVPDPFPLYATAFPRFELPLFNARVFRRPSSKPVVIGHLRRGTVVPAKAAAPGPGCSGGKWHPIAGGGAICTLWGYDVGNEPPAFHGPKQRQPDLSQAIPYRYAKVERQGAPLLRRKPTIKEVLHIEEAESGRLSYPEVVQRRMKGVFMLAIDRRVLVGGRPYYRTVQGQFVAADDIAFRDAPHMRGERLQGTTALPLAFVHGASAPVFRRSGQELASQPSLSKHARLTVKGVVKIGKQTYIEARDGRLIPRDAIRLAQTRTPAKDIPKGAHWIHVDLAEQTLVAYEGKRPVFATLVSSGKKGFLTRPGLFRIESKHISTTMSGPDPEDGYYRIEEVPWTMYYWRSFAVHGAFWHDDFGTPRSHGCTNVAPEDARWLFHWTKPEVPNLWHARLNTRGTWFYFTK